MLRNLSRRLSIIKQNSWRLSTATQQKIKSNQEYTPGSVYNGFLCKEVQFIEDFNMTALIFEHEKTGLKYIHLDRNDSNNLFSINFRTTPFDSTGLPHILEVISLTIKLNIFNLFCNCSIMFCVDLKNFLSAIHSLK